MSETTGAGILQHLVFSIFLKYKNELLTLVRMQYHRFLTCIEKKIRF